MTRLRHRLSWATLALAAASCLTAQSDEPQELEGFFSEEVPIEESILPTTRPFNSVYGTDRSILETPRNVTIISREQLDAISIKTPRDFARLTSSSYTKSNFGAPTSPNLRGQEADLFVNGIRKGLTSNGNGLPINFNAVESVNIVKGPAGSVYGTSNYLGGYADLITKRAFFDEARGSASFTLGSYDVRYWQVDYSTPISDELAVRFSYSGEDSRGFFEFHKKKTQAAYATATYRPSDAYELFVAAEFFVADYTENWGMNRPTQALIDDGLYLPNTGTDAEYLDYVARLGNGAGFFVGGTPGVDYASVFGDAGFATIVPLDLNNPVKLDRSKRLLAPDDDSFGKNFWAQAIQTFRLSDTMRIENNTYYQWIDRNTFSSYHYSELLRDNWSFDNRLQLIIDQDQWAINTGLRYRYQDVWSANHFFNEPVNFWDLTRPATGISRRVPNAGFVAPFNAIAVGEEARGILDYWYIGGGTEDYDGDGEDDHYAITAGQAKTTYLGPFLHVEYEASEQLSLIGSAGFDYIDTETTLPSDITGIPGATGPLPYVSADYNPLTNPDGADSASLWNYSASAVYKVNPTLNLYATYGFSESHEAETGGRVVPNFDVPQESTLVEVGAKANLLENTLFVGGAVFDREFTVRNQDGSVDEVRLNGFEIEFNYQPTRNFYATFGYSYIDSERTAGFFATAYTADRAGETGGLYITPSFPSPGENDPEFYDFPGNPQHQMVALASYTFDNNFGVRANLVVTGPMNLGYEGFTAAVPSGTEAFNNPYILEVSTVEVPWQYEVDLTFFYEYEDWEFKATIFNLTDEDNWDAPNAGYGNGSVVAREPIRIEGTVTYSF
ncbi:MAG: TonB-dependent receptor [Opitutales bacterium]